MLPGGWLRRSGGHQPSVPAPNFPSRLGTRYLGIPTAAALPPPLPTAGPTLLHARLKCLSGLHSETFQGAEWLVATNKTWLASSWEDGFGAVAAAASS